MPGLELRARMPSLAGELDVELALRDRVLRRARFDRDNDTRRFHVKLGPLLLDATLTVDILGGELAAAGKLVVAGRTLFDRDLELLRFSPAVGEVGGSARGPAPVLDDPRFGRSRPCAPVPLRIFVEEEAHGLTDVGKRVKETMFPGYPDFVFNTVPCVGEFEQGRGLYVKPGQRWFNVFLGYYQLDARKSEWSRPFGYRSADGVDSEVAAEDVVRLTKSDWNFFSNWMYGVPSDAVQRFVDVDMSKIQVPEFPPERIGNSLWHRIGLRGVEVVSAYESEAPGAPRLVDNSVLAPIWRASFGGPFPQEKFADSFPGTTLDGDVWMAYHEDEDWWHTLIFGGSCESGVPRDFIDAQLEACRAVIEAHYSDLGF